MYIPAPIGTLIVLVVMLFAVLLSAPLQSERPDEPIRAEESTNQAETDTAPKKGGPKGVLFRSNKIPSDLADAKETKERAERAEAEEKRAQQDLVAQQDMAFWAMWMVVVSGLSVVVASIAVWLVRLTLREARKTTTAAISANKAAIETVAALHRSERAYVTISHEPPGLILDPTQQLATINMNVKNNGRTPATVTDVHLEFRWFKSRSLPETKPSYFQPADPVRIGAFLVAGSHIHFPVENRPIPDQGEADQLWFFGYVDYIDAFKRKHRGGYARIYKPERTEGNLIFPKIHGWNYDEPVKKDQSD